MSSRRRGFGLLELAALAGSAAAVYVGAKWYQKRNAKPTPVVAPPPKPPIPVSVKPPVPVTTPPLPDAPGAVSSQPATFASQKPGGPPPVEAYGDGTWVDESKVLAAEAGMPLTNLKPI